MLAELFPSQEVEFFTFVRIELVRSAHPFIDLHFSYHGIKVV